MLLKTTCPQLWLLSDHRSFRWTNDWSWKLWLISNTTTYLFVIRDDGRISAVFLFGFLEFSAAHLLQLRGLDLQATFLLLHLHQRRARGCQLLVQVLALVLRLVGKIGTKLNTTHKCPFEDNLIRKAEWLQMREWNSGARYSHWSSVWWTK